MQPVRISVARFTKQSRLAREHKTTTVLMGVDSSAVYLLTIYFHNDQDLPKCVETCFLVVNNSAANTSKLPS